MIREEIKEWFKSHNMVIENIDVFWLEDLVNFLQNREIAVLDQQPTILVDVPNGPPIDFVKNFKWKVYDNEDWENTSRSYLHFQLAFSYVESLLANCKGRVVLSFVDESLFSFVKGTKVSSSIYTRLMLLDSKLIAEEEQRKREAKFYIGK